MPLCIRAVCLARRVGLEVSRRMALDSLIVPDEKSVDGLSPAAALLGIDDPAGWECYFSYRCWTSETLRIVADAILRDPGRSVYSVVGWITDTKCDPASARFTTVVAGPADENAARLEMRDSLTKENPDRLVLVTSSEISRSAILLAAQELIAPPVRDDSTSK